jgi:hypothetical protein
MNDMNRNTRTLILCFVIAIMALIPLRFVEVGQELAGMQEVQVLGNVEEVMLPSAELSADSVLEAPYNEIDALPVQGEVAGTSCFAPVDAQVVLTELQTKAVGGQLDRAELDQVINQMIEVENNTCR